MEPLGEPAVEGRQVLVGVGASVVALRKDSGEVLWSSPVAGTVSNRPTAAGDVVYVVDDAGTVTAFDRGEGSRRWQSDVGTVLSPPVAVGDVVLVAVRGQGVVALAGEDGSRRWTVGVSGQPSAVVVEGTTAFVGDGQSAVRAIDVRTGDVRWQVQTDGGHVALADGGRVLAVSGFSGPLVGLDSQTGEQVWESEVMVDWAVPQPGPGGATIFLVVADGHVHAFDATDGTSRRVVTTDRGAELKVGPQGLLYLRQPTGHLSVWSPGGEELWSAQTGVRVRDIAVEWSETAWMVARDHETATRLIGTMAPTRPPPDVVASVPARSACPTTPIQDRPYATVASGKHAEISGLGIQDATTGPTLVIDQGEPDRPLTLRGHQLDGPGRMGFRTSYQQPPRTALTLSNDGMRRAPDWPPHWGLGASLSGPGCWSYTIETDTGTDQIVFEITPETFESLSDEQRHNPADLE